jgi:Radical SAM superfamily
MTTSGTICRDVVLFTGISSRLKHGRPLGAYRLATELRRVGFRAVVIDYFHLWLRDRNGLEDLCQRILSSETVAVGFSSTFLWDSTEDYFDEWANTISGPSAPASAAFLWFLRYLKSEYPWITTLYGGAHALRPFRHEQNITDLIDYYVIGSADGIVANIVTALKDRKRLGFQLSGGKRVLEGDASAHPNSATEATEFCSEDGLQAREVLPIELTRGCPFRCIFCSFPPRAKTPSIGNWRESLDGLSDTFKRNFERFGISRYMFLDNTFNETTDKVRTAHEAVSKSGVAIECSAYLRLDTLAECPEQLELLKRIGLRAALFGIESLNPSTARAIGKATVAEKAEEALCLVRDAWRNDVTVHAFFIAGLPYETPDTLNEWMEWVYRRDDLIDSYRMSVLGFQLSAGSPQSELDRNPRKWGYTVDEAGCWSNRGMHCDDARHAARHWNYRGFASGRIRVAEWILMSLMGLGYDYDMLRTLKLNELATLDIEKRIEDSYQRYKASLLGTADRPEGHFRGSRMQLVEFA